MRHLASCAFLSLGLFAVACGGAGDATSEGEHASSSEPLTTVPLGPNKVEGIDVSHYQGSINWAAEKAAGRLFGVASVGDGLYQDPNFATNWAGMKAAGVIRGAYQFFEPGVDPVQQANIMIAKVGKLGDGDLPATVDVEVTGGQTPATIAAHLATWLAHVEAGTGRKPMIYAGPYFWQDHVASSAFGANPLWIADYGVTSPQLPAPWTTFKIWQYSDSGGALDLDRFHGTLAELQAFARPPVPVKPPPPPNAPPRGSLDGATCTGIKGWAQDPTAPTKAIGVNLLFDGAAGAKTAQLLPVTASTPRTDLCAPLGSCNHSFDVPVPLGVMDNKAHPLFAYGLDTTGGASALLTNAPKSFTCAPPEPPVTVVSGVKRLVPNTTVEAAWKISMLTDVAHYDQARVDAFPKGDDLPAKPAVVIGDDGAPAVWVLDGGKRRHVVSPASMLAWHFAAPAKTPAAALLAMPQGPDWRATPFFVLGTTPALYALDLAPNTPPGTEPPGAAPAAPQSDGASVPPDEAPADAPAASGGCQLAPTPRSNDSLLGAAALALACAIAGRRRHPAKAP